MLGLSMVFLFATLTTLLMSTAAAARIAASNRKLPVSPRTTKNAQYPIRRVQNGEDDTGKYPYVVAVLFKNKFRTCTGAMFAPKWVLSSAHCKYPVYVQYGDMTLPRENITSIREIIKIIHHPSYRSYRYLSTYNATYNDIGLMLIDEIRLASLARLSALDYRTLYGYHVEYAGYGLTGVSNKYSLNRYNFPLQLGSGMVASCRDVQMRLFFNPSLCVVPQCALRQSMMPGDSGGPVFVDGKIVGINVGVVHTSKISICTPLSPYLEWIYEVLSEPVAGYYRK